MVVVGLLSALAPDPLGVLGLGLDRLAALGIGDVGLPVNRLAGVSVEFDVADRIRP